jgi:hypothetical protein
MKIACFTAILVLSALATQVNAAPDVASFVKGDRTIFSTKGHAKSKGLNMEIFYPRGWAPKEARGPNIIQRIASNEGNGSEALMILVKPLPAEWTKEVIDYGFTDAGLQDLLPEFAAGGKPIGAKATKIEGLPAGLLEYTSEGERLGVRVRTHTLNCVFPYEGNLISVTFSVTSVNKDDDISEQFRQNAPLFLSIANTIHLPDKWNK